MTSSEVALENLAGTGKRQGRIVPILDLVRRPSRHCCAIQSAVTRVGIGLRMSTSRPVPRPSPSASVFCLRDLLDALDGVRIVPSVRLGIATLQPSLGTVGTVIGGGYVRPHPDGEH